MEVPDDIMTEMLDDATRAVYAGRAAGAAATWPDANAVAALYEKAYAPAA